MTVETDTADSKNAQYAHPERLVSTQWLADHLGDPGLVVVESDEDVLLYETGHIPGAVKIDWHTDLNDPVVRDYVDGDGLREARRQQGHLPRLDRGHLRRQEQLVGRVRLWGVLPLRARGCPPSGRRSCEVGGGRPRVHDRRADPRCGRLPGRAARGRRHPRLQGRACSRTSATRSSMSGPPRSTTVSALPPRVSRGGRAARRPHPHRGERAVGEGRRRRTARSAASTSSTRSTARAPVSPTATTSSRTAASVSVRATPGSCSRTCSATRSVRNYDGSWTEWGTAVRVPIVKGSEPGSPLTERGPRLVA